MTMRATPVASPIWTKLWIAWAIAGVGGFLGIIIASELGWDPPPHVWRWWAAPGVLGGAALEVAALINGTRGDTLSEHVWRLDRGWRSLVVAFCLWFAWFLGTGGVWPSIGVTFLIWVAYHFQFEGGTKRSQVPS